MTKVELQQLNIMVDHLPTLPLTGDERNTAPKTVCVTGALGYVAGPIIERLLAAGHTVHGTVRQNSPAATALLRALPGAAERLTFFEADLLKPDSFDKAVAGCDVVIHVAAVVKLNVRKGKGNELIVRPAVEGTRNVVSSINKSASVKKVVLTSSTLAIVACPFDHPDGVQHLYTRDDLCKIDDPDQEAYSLAKREQLLLMEKLCAEQSRWSLASVHPSGVLGPSPTNRRDSESVDIWTKLGTGAFPVAPRFYLPICDTRVVAAAHCRAAMSKVTGRFIVSSEQTYTFVETAKMYAASHPNLKKPMGYAWYWILWLLGPFMGLPRVLLKKGWSTVGGYRLDVSDARRELGMDTYWIDTEKTVQDHMSWMIQQGFLTDKGKRIKG